LRPGVPRKKIRARIRRLELRLEGFWLLGCRIIPLELPSYEEPGYQPGEADFGTVIPLFAKHQPGAVLCPGPQDRNPAHRAARALVAEGLLGADLDYEVPVLSYWSPSGAIADPNAVHECSRTAALLKRLAVAAHCSQRLNADYARYSYHMSRAYVPLVRRLRGGFHEQNGQNHRPLPSAVEFYRREVYTPAEGKTRNDPLMTVLGIQVGDLDPFPPFRSGNPVDRGTARAEGQSQSLVRAHAESTSEEDR
jgi:hypothetical protein